MSHLGYLIAGWSISIGTLAVYAIFLLRRGKKLTEKVPAGRRRWISSTEEQSRITDG
jgi:hypothetical protein